MTAAGLAPGTVHTRVQNLRAVLRGAVRDRVIAADPSDGVTLPRRRRREHAMSIPTPPQVGALLAAADDRFAAFIAICAFGGLRLGEAAALQVGMSTSSGAGWWSAGRFSEDPAARSNCEHPSTARSGRSSSPTGY
jgi:integrase